MTRSVSEDEVETAFTAWARESLAATTVRPFSVAEDVVERRLTQRRRMMPVLTAAVVLVLVAVSLAVRYVGHPKAAPTTQVAECPRHAPRAGALPNGGEPLFARPVAEMTACSYTRGRLIAPVPLDHRLAETLAEHLSHAATTSHDPLLCLTITSFSELLALDPQGDPLAPVTITAGCRRIAATNGTTTRYLDTSDPAFQQADRYVYRHR